MMELECPICFEKKKVIFSNCCLQKICFDCFEKVDYCCFCRMTNEELEIKTSLLFEQSARNKKRGEEKPIVKVLLFLSVLID